MRWHGAFCARVVEGRFDLALYREHQIRQLVDDQHDVREDAAEYRRERQLLLNAGLHRQRLGADP